MKLGPVTKLDKRNMATSKVCGDDVLSANGDVIVFFSNLWPICSHLGAGFQTHGL